MLLCLSLRWKEGTPLLFSFFPGRYLSLLIITSQKGDLLAFDAKKFKKTMTSQEFRLILMKDPEFGYSF